MALVCMFPGRNTHTALALHVTTAQIADPYQFIAILELEDLIDSEHCNRRAGEIGGIES